MSPPSLQPAGDVSPAGGPLSPLAMFRGARTAFFGRDHDVARLLALLRDPAVRLVTLLGPGGVGKTTLALEALARIQQEGAAEVAFVPLADLRDRSLVNATVAVALGVDPGDASPLDGIAAAIGGRSMILALDNLEHLLPLDDGVATLLERCPRLTVLATSRIPLQIAGEHRVAVPPLPLAGPDEPFDALADSPAVRLFAARARTANPAFRLASGNAPVIASICQRVDGLPLAIELAAASSRFYSPDAILTRLDARAMPLATGDRDLPARQQSMYGAIAWSYDLLDEAAQALFTALGAFAGGFTVEAAEAVLPSLFSLPGLDGLVEHGLVLQTANVLGEPRFAMLETVREFAEERLRESGREEKIRSAHADHFVSLAERLEPELMSADPLAVCLRIAADLPNYRLATAGLRARGQIADALRL
ncbi:MAG: AAA family ATPase, partial [Chloroflexota bacterium]|nr:AAA family ATPase [Chloroflexota bacterium]